VTDRECLGHTLSLMLLRNDGPQRHVLSVAGARAHLISRQLLTPRYSAADRLHAWASQHLR
jgi:hypothetical protein